MAKWQFTRPGTWTYPTLGFSASTGDVLDATNAPDAWWDSVDAGTPATIGVSPVVDYVEPVDGTVLSYNAATNRYDERNLDEMLEERIDDTGSATRASLNATIGAEATPRQRSFESAEGLSFTRHAGNPVFTAAAQNPAVGATAPTTSASIYWPWIVNAAALFGGSALDTYYLYYTTNHGAGGVWLATAPAITGPWTGRGQVFNDTTSGTQTETASVVWNEDEDLLFMYYQQAGVSGANGSQSTLLATSATGLAGSWTRVGIVLDVPAGNKVPGDGHTGYFVPFRLGKQWYGYGLYGGGNYPHFALWRSRDGRSWNVDGNLLRYGTDQLDDAMLINWNSGGVVQINGALWWIGLATTFVSGGGTKDGKIIAAPLSDDMRTLKGRPLTLLYPPAGAETTNLQSLFVTVEDGRIVLVYQIGTGFNVAVSD